MIHITDPDSTADYVVYTDHAWTPQEIDEADDRYMLFGVAALGLIVGLCFGWLWALKWFASAVVGWFCAACWEWVATPKL